MQDNNLGISFLSNIDRTHRSAPFQRLRWSEGLADALRVFHLTHKLPFFHKSQKPRQTRYSADPGRVWAPLRHSKGRLEETDHVVEGLGAGRWVGAIGSAPATTGLCQLLHEPLPAYPRVRAALHVHNHAIVPDP